jgi:hypothetical protein
MCCCFAMTVIRCHCGSAANAVRSRVVEQVVRAVRWQRGDDRIERAPGTLAVLVHNEVMRHGRVAGQFLRSAATWLLAVVLSPLIVVAGEWLRRFVLARPVARQAQRSWRRVPRRLFGRPRSVAGPWRPRQFLVLLVTNPLWIALTAPTRWLLGRAGGLGPRRQRPPDAGVREPRRPKPGLPGGSVALAEPRAAPIIARLLGTVSRGPRHQGDREAPGRKSRRRRAGGR